MPITVNELRKMLCELNPSHDQEVVYIQYADMGHGDDVIQPLDAVYRVEFDPDAPNPKGQFEALVLKPEHTCNETPEGVDTFDEGCPGTHEAIKHEGPIAVLRLLQSH